MKKVKKLTCPKCGGENLQFVGNNRKAFSVSKAVGGAVLSGGIGVMAGFIGKKSKKNSFICLDCGKEFKVKG